jgi:hypothetical protein
LASLRKRKASFISFPPALKKVWSTQDFYTQNAVLFSIGQFTVNYVFRLSLTNLEKILVLNTNGFRGKASVSSPNPQSAAGRSKGLHWTKFTGIARSRIPYGLCQHAVANRGLAISR